MMIKSQSKALIVLFAAAAWLGASSEAAAQDEHTAGPVAESPETAPRENGPWEGFDRARLSLLAGLIQPILLGGGNAEIDLHWKRLVLGYSHGFLLNLEGGTVVGDAADQGLAFHLPYSTGFSVGYRMFEWLDARIDGKVHRFEVRDEATGEDLFSYTTFTLGVGLYAQYRPFYHFGVRTRDWLEGIVLTTSVRYWPNLATSLTDDEVVYNSPSQNAELRHRAANIGIANSPFLFNIAVGYSFQF